MLHPTSSDRYVPSGAPKAKRRNTTSSTAPPTTQSTESQSPVPPTPSTSQYPQVCRDSSSGPRFANDGTLQTAGMTPFMTPTTPGYPSQAYPFPQQSPVQDPPGSYPTVSPYGPAPDPSAWGYSASTPLDRPSQPFGPPALPSIHTIGRTESQGSGTGANADVGFEATSPAHASDSWQVTSGARDESDAYRWQQEPHSFSTIDNTPTSAVDPALREASIQSPTTHTQAWSASPIDAYSNARYNMVPVAGPVAAQTVPSQQPPQPQQQVETSMYASASYAQQQHQQQQQQAQAQASSYPHGSGGYTQDTTTAPPPSTIPPLPRHTYTRTLVGPLSANACRLLDEHRKPGIFFLFQDLSIRTEGAHPVRLFGLRSFLRRTLSYLH